MGQKLPIGTKRKEVGSTSHDEWHFVELQLEILKERLYEMRELVESNVDFIEL